ncbi:MAG: hypothetical protein SNJ70_08245, partial [Armatimonadota bacterium]
QFSNDDFRLVIETNLHGTFYAARAVEGEPFIRLRGVSTGVKGLLIAYPEFNEDTLPPVPYPPTIFSDRGSENVFVIDTMFYNVYEAIHFNGCARFLISNVHGNPIKRGIFIDRCMDIGRVENVHFWPFGPVYETSNKFSQWVNTHGVAFEFARTDWQYVFNTFCFGYGVGYKFSDYGSGGANGNFLGLGADCCERAIVVEQAQAVGILITNGEFVGKWGSNENILVEIQENVRGKVSIQNSSFWGPNDISIWMKSPYSQVTAIGCHFNNWGNKGVGSPAIKLDAGKAIIQGNTFGEGLHHISVAEKVESAIVIGNQAIEGMVITNNAGGRLQLVANEESTFNLDEEKRKYYKISIGKLGDGRFLMNWHDREHGGEWDENSTKRWSGIDSQINLPILKDKAYSIGIEVFVPEWAIDENSGLYLGDKKITPITSAGKTVYIGKIPPQKTDVITLTLKVKNWQPKDHIENSKDARSLGIAVRSITMKSEKAEDRYFDVNKREWITSIGGGL